jgi:anti-anti-sigma factor
MPVPPDRSPVHLGTSLFSCGRTAWLRLRGVLSWRTADQFRCDVEAVLAPPCRRLVVDLTGIDYVGGDILRALVRWQEQLRTKGIDLRLVVTSGSRCARSMTLGGLQAVIPIFTCPSAAWRHRRRKSAAATAPYLPPGPEADEGRAAADM